MATNGGMQDVSNRESLFKSWLAEYHGILFRVSRSYARSASEAMDLEQELRLQLWNSLPAFSGKAKPSTWIYRVCLNTALTWLRTRTRHERKFDPDAELNRIPSANTSPVDHASEAEILEKLYASIQSLPDFDRALVLLSLDGVSYREIAEITGLSEGNIGMSLTRARQRLTNLMKGVTHELGK